MQICLIVLKHNTYLPELFWKTEKIGDFFVFTWLIFAGLVTYFIAPQRQMYQLPLFF